MCGIVGANGKIDVRKFIIDGLSDLDYRGYDSAGIGYLSGGEVKVFKCAGRVEDLAALLPEKINSSLAIGHTRWATHGKPSTTNSHPHTSMNELFTIVHNGVIENFTSIKEQLTSLGYTFKSSTDTEVIANLVEHYYLESKGVLSAIEKAMAKLEGSFACVIIFKNEPHNLYLMKRSSPLIIGLANECLLVASDATPMIKYTNSFVDLEDNEYGYISDKEYFLFKDGNPVNKKPVQKDPDLLVKDLNGYPHFMLKEIEESEQVLLRIINKYVENDKFLFDEKLLAELKESDHIIFLGCGTSYHASLIGARYFRSIGKTVSNYIASEWVTYPSLTGKQPFVIMLSQSGETADLTHCLSILKSFDVKTLVITNNKGSYLETNCDYSLLLDAGLEVSVASTKAYVAQVSSLALLVAALSNDTSIVKKLYAISHLIASIRDHKKDSIYEIAQKVKEQEDIYFLGRGYDYDLALEASLKLKEISYIHSEAVPGGELKHGPIALISKGVPVLVVISDPKTASLMRNNIQEVLARGASVYVVSLKSLSMVSDNVILDDVDYALASIAISTVAFYFAYYVALLRGNPIDKPRNLAKAVTVE